MLIRKIWTGTMTAVAVVAFASWASVASAALPEDVAAALSADKTPAQQQAAIRALAIAHAGDAEAYTQLVQLVAAGVPQDQAAAFAGALAAACGVSGNVPQTTAILVNGKVGVHHEAGGAIVGQVIANGCSAEVAAATLQEALVAAAGGSLGLIPVLPNTNPGTGVNLLQEAFVKSLNTTRLGNVLQGLQETAMSPTLPNGAPPTTNGED